MGIESIRNSLRGGCEAMIELKNVSFTYLSENSDESSAELNGSLSNIDLRIEHAFKTNQWLDSALLFRQTRGRGYD